METKIGIDFACMAPGSEKTVEAIWEEVECNMCKGEGIRYAVQEKLEEIDFVCPYCGGKGTMLNLCNSKEIGL